MCSLVVLQCGASSIQQIERAEPPMPLESTLLTGYLFGDPARPEEARGDFVVGHHHPTRGWAISSVIGAFPWYYTVSPRGELIQGSNVFELCAAAKLSWQWNMTAVSQIATVGHTLGTHT